MQRLRDDAYITPAWVCEATVRALHARDHLAARSPPRFVLDPGAGAGAWGRAVNLLVEAEWPDAHVCGVEKRETHKPIEYTSWIIGDYLAPDNPAARQRYDLIIGNPPYRLAEAFIERSMPLLAPPSDASPLGGTLAFLLRLNFLGGQQRRKQLWVRLAPSHVWVLSKRPSFAHGRTDATEYAIFVWTRRTETKEILLGWL